jgi:hypothetical protein
MPIPLAADRPSLCFRREAYERAALVRAAIDERLGLTPDEFRVEGNVVVVGPVHDEDALGASSPTSRPRVWCTSTTSSSCPATGRGGSACTPPAPDAFRRPRPPDMTFSLPSSTPAGHAGPRRALTRRAAGAALLVLVGAAACAKPRPVPLSVQLQGEPRILRVPPELIRDTTGRPIGVQPGRADAFYGRTAPALERWGVEIRIGIEPAYVAAIILRQTAYDSLAVSPAAAIGLAQLTAATDAELREHSAVYPWMAAEVASWPRDAAVHGAESPGTDDSARPIAPAAVRARLAAGTLTARNEYLFDAERSARAAMFWVKLLQDRWTREGGPRANTRRSPAAPSPTAARPATTRCSTS